jgi:hypothetical protein
MNLIFFDIQKYIKFNKFRLDNPLEILNSTLVTLCSSFSNV